MPITALLEAASVAALPVLVDRPVAFKSPEMQFRAPPSVDPTAALPSLE
jgi:hypothetical protein